MAAVEELVSGVVVGERGTPVAGYVKIGAKGPRRPVGTTLALRTDDGHEVELVDVAIGTIVPEVTRKAAWQELEREPGASACLADAPAPDVVVELCSALVRGGDRIAAWGKVRQHAFASATSGGAYRDGAERRVAMLAPDLLVVGEQCVERLEKLRATPAYTPLPPPPREKAKEAPAPAPKPKPKPRPKGPHYERGEASLGTWIALPVAIGLLAALALLGRELAPALLVVLGGVLALPLTSDAIALPRYRTVGGVIAQRTTAAGVYLFVLLVVATCVLLLARDQSQHLDVLALVAAPVLLVTGVLVARACAPRVRFTALVAKAPPHAEPIVEGTWGALDGRATSARPVEIDGHDQLVICGQHVKGWGTRDSKGTWTSYDTKPLLATAPALSVERAGAVTEVNPHGALWFTTSLYDRRSPDGSHHFDADVIRDGANVRIVGRRRGSEIAKGGAASLLIFATEPGGDVARAVQRYHRRDLVGRALAALGGLVVIAGAILAIV